jgi:hypothetical protein
MKLVCALIVASYRKPESFLLKFSTPQEESKWPDPLDGFSSSKLTRTSTSAKGRSIHHLWYLFFFNPSATDPCSWLTVGLLYILVSVEAESPVAVFQPLSNLVVGIILQLVTRPLRASKGAESQQPGSRSSKAHRKRTCGGKGSFFTMLHLHGRRAWH